MKLKNILSILGSIFLLTACSSEEDAIIGNDINAVIDTASNKYAAIAMKVSVSGSLATKATESIEAGVDTTIAATETINKVSMLVVTTDGTVLAAKDGVILNASTSVTNETFIVKSQSNLKVIIVANSNVEFAACRTLAEANTKFQESADLSSFVKYGIADASITKEYVSPTEALENPNTVEVNVQQLAARVELNSFTVADDAFSFGNTKPAPVVIEAVSLKNIKHSCLTQISDNEVAEAANTGLNWDQMGGGITVFNGTSNVDIVNKPYFYTFPSNVADDSAVEMYIKFKVGGNDVKRIYKIQHEKGIPSVKSGYVYRLNINLTRATSDDIQFDVTCYTLDWNYKKVNVTLSEE